MTRRSLGWAFLCAAALLRCSSFSASSPEPLPDAGPATDAAVTDAVDPVDPPDGGPGPVLPEGCDPTCGGDHGPCGVRVAQGAGCIDATEVTVGDWRGFVAAAPVGSTSPGCAPGQPAPIGAKADDLPITDVTFCEARAFCEWAGKKLCGRVDGGKLAFGDLTQQVSLWFNACTAGSTDPVTILGDAGCNLASDRPVPSRATCQGGILGVFGMVGNVAEWLDAVEPDGQGFKTYAIGSDYFGHVGDTCQLVSQRSLSEHAPNLGFRCCSTD